MGSHRNVQHSTCQKLLKDNFKVHILLYILLPSTSRSLIPTIKHCNVLSYQGPELPSIKRLSTALYQCLELYKHSRFANDTTLSGLSLNTLGTILSITNCNRHINIDITLWLLRKVGPEVPVSCTKSIEPGVKLIAGRRMEILGQLGTM